MREVADRIRAEARQEPVASQGVVETIARRGERAMSAVVTAAGVLENGGVGGVVAEVVGSTEVDREDSVAAIFVEPRLDPEFVVDEKTRDFLRAVARVSAERPVNVGLRGPTGCGKTSLAEWFAAMIEAPAYFVLDMSTLREPKELFGFKEVTIDGATGAQLITWHRSGFLHAISTPGAVVLLDEATRIHPSVANNLMPLLDHRRQAYLDDLGEIVRVAEGVVFFLTANIGLEYSGTWRWDAALENRLDFQLEVDYLPVDEETRVLVSRTGIEEETARRLSEVAHLVRQGTRDDRNPISHGISTRQLLAAATLVAEGLTPIEALEFTVVPTYSADGGPMSDRANVLTIIQGKLGA